MHITILTWKVCAPSQKDFIGIDPSKYELIYFGVYFSWFISDLSFHYNDYFIIKVISPFSNSLSIIVDLGRR